MEHDRSGVQREGCVGDDAAHASLALGVVHNEHMVGELLAKTQLRLVLRLFLRMGRFGDFNVQHNFTLSLLLLKRTAAQQCG